jgi:hypothetical protein
VTTLCLDFDRPTVPRDLWARIQQLARQEAFHIDCIGYTPTRHGWHVVVRIRQRLSPALIVAAQAILGSDYRREMFVFRRVRSLRRVPPEWREAHRWNTLYSSHTRGF